MPRPNPAQKFPPTQYPPVQLATNMWPWRLLNNDLVTATAALPATDELDDLVFTEKPFEPQNDEANGFLCWTPRPGSICEIRVALTDAENETVNMLFGMASPLERFSPVVGDPVQWRLDALAVMTWTAGAQTGTAGGILNASHYYADTVAITKALWPDPNPLRIVGPRTSADDGTLVPDDTPVGIQFDIMGGMRPFVYLDLGTAAGVHVLERSF